MIGEDGIIKWETVCESPLTQRLDVLRGWLYKVNDSLAFVPDEGDTEYNMERLLDAIEALKDLFEETTFTFNNGEARVIRIGDVNET